MVYSGGDLGYSKLTDALRPTEHTELRVLCPGRLNAWKGQEVLIRALGLIAGNERKIITRIVGGEYGGTVSFRESLVREISISGAPDVELIGELLDLDAQYLWSDVVVVPSKRAEPFGKVVIEAMNHARVVIATDMGGPAEVVINGETGLLVAPNDPVALSKALLLLADDVSLRHRLGDQAHARSLDFDASKAAVKIVHLIAPHA